MYKSTKNPLPSISLDPRQNNDIGTLSWLVSRFLDAETYERTEARCVRHFTTKLDKRVQTPNQK